MSVCNRGGEYPHRSRHSEVVRAGSPGLMQVGVPQYDRHQCNLEEQQHQHEQTGGQYVQNSAEDRKTSQHEANSADQYPEGSAEGHPVRNHMYRALRIGEVCEAKEDSAESESQACDERHLLSPE